MEKFDEIINKIYALSDELDKEKIQGRTYYNGKIIDFEVELNNIAFKIHQFKELLKEVKKWKELFWE